MDDPYDPMLAEAVAHQDPNLPALERVCAGVLEAWQGVDGPTDEMTRKKVELAASHPSLRARVWENNRRTEEVIVASLTDTGTPGFEATIATGAVLGALTGALFDWAAHGTVPLGELIREAMEQLAPQRALT